ncbi:MAG TPA: zf-HC2 domain-containing protein, partial [Steroidobacteraceae bacterium]|nr:zf-HC2 domain-containing protein [Steroidobacteraceae bacterium]
MQCPESLRLQAYFDGEVDAVASADIEQHMERCAECRALQQSLEQLRSALRRDLPYAETPPALRARIMQALDEASGRSAPQPQRRGRTLWRIRPFWMGAASGIGAAAIAATAAFLFIVPLTTPMVDELVSAHVNSLLPTHLIDVVSTDQHTVKPWFAGHTDVSPVVADFEPQGYKLVGGRVDYLEHQRAAVVVYQHGAHVINVFSWAAAQRSLPDRV